VVGPLAGGETGATAIEDVHGRLYVLKWELDPGNAAHRIHGARLAERLRVEAGWPAPKQRTITTDECLLVVQELMPGRVVTRLTHGLVESLFDLHERRLRLEPEPDEGAWASDMIEVLVHGGNGYCLHEPLRRFDHRTRRIVERIEEIGRSLDPEDLAGRDVVHGDLHVGNLLHVDDRLSAVVDMDYTRVGDAAFDLATLAISSLDTDAEGGVRARLLERGIAALSEPKRDAYVANLLLRCLDWPIRKGRPAEVEHWIVEADRLLPP
jgi:hypothetical protein